MVRRGVSNLWLWNQMCLFSPSWVVRNGQKEQTTQTHSSHSEKCYLQWENYTIQKVGVSRQRFWDNPGRDGVNPDEWNLSLTFLTFPLKGIPLSKQTIPRDSSIIFAVALYFNTKLFTNIMAVTGFILKYHLIINTHNRKNKQLP